MWTELVPTSIAATTPTAPPTSHRRGVEAGAATSGSTEPLYDPTMTAPRPAHSAELVQLGWDAHWGAAWEAASVPQGTEPARLVRTDRRVVTVWRRVAEAERATTTTAAKDTVAGDWVALDAADERIASILPRRTRFERRAARGARRGQVLAANMDVVWVVQAAEPGVAPRRLERELVLAHQGGATPLVVVTKTDLVDDPEEHLAAARRVACGVDVVAVSAPEGVGLDRLAHSVDGNRTAALIGASGVGKSTIVNALLGHERQATAEVRHGDRKGRHTTTAAELIALPEGGFLIDTPGVRALALWDAGGGLAATFPEIAEVGAGCRFDDCTHRSEPGCEVLEAVEAGRIDAERHRHWVELGDELAATHRPEY